MKTLLAKERKVASQIAFEQLGHGAVFLVAVTCPAPVGGFTTAQRPTATVK